MFCRKAALVGCSRRIRFRSRHLNAMHRIVFTSLVRVLFSPSHAECQTTLAQAGCRNCVNFCLHYNSPSRFFTQLHPSAFGCLCIFPLPQKQPRERSPVFPPRHMERHIRETEPETTISSVLRGRRPADGVAEGIPPVLAPSPL